MKTKRFHRLAVSTALALFGFTMASTGPIGCSSSPKKVEIDASASPSEEAKKLHEDIDAGFSNHFDVLAQKDFDNAQKETKKADEQLARGATPEKILATIGYARAYLNRAQERTNSLMDRSKGILEARSAALAAGVRNFPQTRAGLKDQDDELRSEVDNIANGRTTTARWADLQKGYQNLELAAIQESKLSEAEAKVYGAVKHGAKKNTPNMLTRAERDLQNAKNVIAADRHDEEKINAAVRAANESADLLIEILAATKRPEGVINEDAAKALVMAGHKVKSLEGKLGVATSATSEQGRQIAEQQGKLQAAGAVLSLDKALDSARKEFSPDEAEVYRQGNKLLIRLKAVNFPSGKADLPTQALPLLSKVKTIAEELNPQQIVIEGHTDSTGKAQLNKVLSQDRAQAVATYLGSAGLDKDKIEAVGYGFEKPLSSNKSKAGRAQNRRVDVVITPSAAGAGTQSM